ncbi:MAG: TonB family protein [Vicinamibacteria bacterium]
MVSLLALFGFAFVSQSVDWNEQLRHEVREGHYQLAENLLENPEVDPDAQDREGFTALMYAVRSDDPELVVLLLKAGVDLDRVNQDRETALIIAVRRGNVEAARQLLMAGADLNARDARGRTALDWAEEENHTYLSQIIRISSRPSVVKVTVAEKPVDLGSEPLVPPRVVKETPPLYTKSAFDRRIEGRVVLTVIVRKDGSIGPIRVQQSLEDELDEAAVEAVRKWRFDPAKLRGEPINVLANIEVDFSIQKHKKG